MVDLVALRDANAKRWSMAKPTRSCINVARSLISPAAKARYQSVAAQTGVPWFFIAVIHERESSQDWSASLAQGDPWDKVSVHVPVGRGPFKSWEEAAVDALVDCPPYAARNQDWSTGAMLTLLEQYNGLGYAARGLPSPYLWAGTDQYKSGKFTRDGFFSPAVVDQQLGCVSLLTSMMLQDPSIDIAPIPPQVEARRTPPSAPAPTPAPIAAFLQAILLFFKSFKRGK